MNLKEAYIYMFATLDSYWEYKYKHKNETTDK